MRRRKSTREPQKKRTGKMKKLTALFAGLTLLCLAADSPDSPYGVCAHVCKGEEWKLAEPKFSVLKSGGICWVRNGFTWGQAEPKQGVWDYSKLDIVAETAKKHGIDFLPILAYDVPWAHPAYRHLEQWREYVRRTVSRYAKQFRYWEIWNEPNINEKPGSLVPPENYVELLKAAHEEIKKIDPELKVVFGGTSGVPVAYLEKCLKAGAADFYDVMNIHPYLNRRKPEEVFKLLNPLFELQKKYKAEKPVWVTEFSWPTHKFEPVLNPQVLDEALKVFGLDRRTVQVAVIRNPDLENFRGKAFAPEDYTAAFPNRKNISYEDLKNLDVRQYPVLIPSLTQAFPRTYFKDVVDYVRRGGVIIHSFGFPFYCDATRDADGRWIQNSGPDEKMMKALHIKWLAGWRDNVPRSGKIAPAPGRSVPAIRFKGSERYLSAENLKPGDELIPLYIQTNKEFSAPVAGVYKFNSDLKGGMIADVNFWENGVSQEVQGEFLAREYLCFLSSGIQKIFWYKFRAEEYDKSCNGHHFGIVHRDYSPRDAFKAYRNLIRLCPEGSTRPVLTNDGNLFSAEWKQPDGTKVCALWAVERPVPAKLPFEVREAFDHLGNPLKPEAIRTISEGPVYLIAK